jgi:hypothetical protein
MQKNANVVVFAVFMRVPPCLKVEIQRLDATAQKPRWSQQETYTIKLFNMERK